MKHILLVVTFIAAAAIASAQTVTVDASLASPNNTTTFKSLVAAVSSFQASGDVNDGTDGAGLGKNHGNAAADVVNIVSSTAISEIIVFDALAAAANGLHVLDADITIQGFGVRGILEPVKCGYSTLMSSTGTAANYGLIWRQPVNLTLKNVAIIPDKTTPATSYAAYFRATATGLVQKVDIDDVILTSNNGSDAPVTTTGLDTPDLAAAGVVCFGGHAMGVVSRTEGGSMTVNATNLIIASHNKTAGNFDGIVVFMSGATKDEICTYLNLGPGCVIANTPRFGIQNPYGGAVNIQGSASKPVIIQNTGGDGIWNYSDTDSPTQPTSCEVNYAIFNKIKGTAIKEQEDTNRGFIKSVKNTIISNTTEPGIALFAAGARPASVSDTVSITSVTLFNCGYSSAATPAQPYAIAAPIYSTTYKSNRNVTMSNVIIAGAGLTGLYNDGTGTFTIDYSALVNEASYALTTASAGASTITVGANVIGTDPMFKKYAITEYADADYMDILNSAYSVKGPGGMNLFGGANYLGTYVPPTPSPTPVPPAGASNWNIYE